jgi:hypothetical protein
MSWCLPKYIAEDFKNKVDRGVIDIKKLSNMTSGERRNFFETFVGKENAKQLNASFESKLLLKSQQKALEGWVDKMSGLKPELKRDTLARIQRLQAVLEPKQMDEFLSDFIEQKLGMKVTYTEATAISKLAQEVKAKKDKDPHSVEYGLAKVAFDDFVSTLKTRAETIHLKDYLTNPLSTIWKTIKVAPGVTKSFKASLDHSALFLQGWKMLCTHPAMWFKSAAKSFGVMWDSFIGNNPLDMFHAITVSDPLYDVMKRAKLDVYGVREESFPSAIPNRFWILGRFYKTAEAGFVYFNQKNRVDVFRYYYYLAKKSGVDVEDVDQLQSIAKLCNSLTARGHLGKIEPIASTLNNVFFSPRNLKANFDVLTAHVFQKRVSNFVRIQAAKNLFKIIVTTAIVLAIADALDDKSVDWDARSANFGKIKKKNTRFDVTGGMGSIVVLARRFTSWSIKSSTTGKITKLNTGKPYSPTVMDISVNFFSNKFSPTAALMRDIFLTGTDFEGKPIKASNAVADLIVPLGIQNTYDTLKDPNSADAIAVILADTFGIAANTYK